ncbi:MAG: histidinol-phosphate transaminase [Vicinamibacterales bacterium]
MSLSRRRLLTGLRETQTDFGWISARGREAHRAGHVEAQMGTAAAKLIRISSNENPLGPGQHVVDAIAGAYPQAARYPGNATQRDDTLIGALAKKYGARDANVVLGAGSGEILTSAVRAFTSASRPLVTAWPSFEAPRETAKQIGTPVREVGFDAGLKIDLDALVAASKGAGLVFFCNPNNPTATVHGKTAVAETVKAIHAASPDTVILIDEAYHDYVTDPTYETAIPMALSTPNLFVARTFSKAHGMAGLRAGYAIGDPAAIKTLDAHRLKNGVGTLTLAGAVASLANVPHISAERARNTEVRAYTVKAFEEMGISGTDSQTNFLFMDIKRPAKGFRDACRAAGVLVGRDFPPFEQKYCRISIGTMDEMHRAVAVFKQVLGGAATTSRQQAGR